MHFLLRLPLILLELALRGGAGALKDLLRLVAGGAAEAERAPTAEEEAEAVAAASARREAERLAAREAAARRPEARPGAARRSTRPAPPRAVPDPAQPARAHVSEEPTPVASFGPADGPGAALEVEPPWPNYDQQSAAEVVKRVRAGDEATRAVVLLYERSHKARKSVIAAAQAAGS
jgi:hypothetical protein